MKKLSALMLAIAMVCTFAGSSSAADWSLYGSARMATFWIDGEDGGVADIDNAVGPDDETLQWDIQANSRIGSKVKAGDVKGHFEFGVNTATITSRIIWGEWDFGPGSLGLGQAYVPVTSFISGQIFGTDLGLVTNGAAYGGRRPMIRLEFGGFQLAALNVSNESALGTGGDVDVTLPKFEAAYELRKDKWYAKIFGGIQTYEIENIPGGGNIDVDSYIVGAHAGVFFGPVELAAGGYVGQNLGQYGLANISNDDAVANAALGDTVDNDAWGAVFAIRYKVTDMARLEAGYGFVQTDRDLASEDETAMYYTHCMLTLAKGVYVIPEIGIIDFKDNFGGADEGKEFYAGAKWQIDF